MILVVTNTQDTTVDYTLPKWAAMGTSFFRLDTDRFVTGYDVTYRTSPNETWRLRCRDDGTSAVFSQITGVWYRRPVPPVIGIVGADAGIEADFSTEARRTYESIVASLRDVPWVSSPLHIHAAEDRLAQLRTARRLGLAIPPTLITNEPDELLAFVSENGPCVVKSLYGGLYATAKDTLLLYTSPLTPHDLERSETVRNFPIVCQKLLQKRYELRATVVRDRVFAVKIDSQAHPETQLDWRVQNCELACTSPILLSEELSQACVRLVNAFDIAFASMDIVVAKDDTHYFLDLNPNGQWAWLDHHHDLGIAEAIAKELSG